MFFRLLSYVKRNKKNNQKHIYCSQQCNRAKLGIEQKGTPKAKVTPCLMDIAWAAGIYEGEGAANKYGGVSVGQNEQWILKKLKRLFGGKIYQYKNYKHSSWYIGGARGRGFLLTIYKFLSPRRKKQIRKIV